MANKVVYKDASDVRSKLKELVLQFAPYDSVANIEEAFEHFVLNFHRLSYRGLDDRTLILNRRSRSAYRFL